jgi:hypothetical protein
MRQNIPYPRERGRNDCFMIVTSINRDALICMAANDWHNQLDSDRPIYDCPNCKESGMQFFAQRLDMPGREDFFYCRACGSSWEM